MGALALRKARRATGAQGGLLSAGLGLVKRAISSPAARVIPGLGTIGAIASVASLPFAAKASASAATAVLHPIRTAQRLVPGGMTGNECPKGYHWSKRSGKCVRNRRMNPMNGRAAGRAIRRIKAAEKMLKKIFAVSHGGPAVKVKPKTRRK